MASTFDYVHGLLRTEEISPLHFPHRSLAAAFLYMTGPGKVYLQSLPFSPLVNRIKRGITLSQSGGAQRGVAGLGGDILKNIISGS